MSDLQQAIAEALAKLGAAAGVPAAPAPAPSYDEPTHRPALRVVRGGLAPAPVHHATAPARGRDGVTKEMRDAEGRYCTDPIDGAACYVHAVELKAGKPMAYVRNRTTKQVRYIPWADVTDLRDEP